MKWDFIEENITKITIVSAALIIAMICSHIYLYSNASGNLPEVVAIDTNEIIADFISINKNLNMTEAELNNLVDKFGANLGKLINERAKKEHLIFVPKQAIIAGGRDYTSSIKQELLTGL